MQQARLGRQTRPHDMLEIPLLVPLDIRQRVAVARPRDQGRRVDDQRAEILDILAESGQSLRRRPDVGRGILREIREVVRGGVLQFRVLVEGAVDVV